MLQVVRVFGWLIAALLLASTSAACDPRVDPSGGGGGSEPNPNFPTGAADASSVNSADLLLDAINDARALHALGPVVAHDVLRCAAEGHASDLSGTNSCSHDGSNGSTPGDRVAACGSSSWSGEIVACGQLHADEAVDGWLASPGHRTILLDPDQDRVGVAVDGTTWVAVFRK